MENNSVIKKDLEEIVSSGLDWQRFANKSILVTGGSGFLASYLVKTLLVANEIYALDLKVLCMVRSKRNVHFRLDSFLDDSSLVVIEHDVSASFPKSIPRADFIIHSASQASPKYYGVDPVGTLMANTAGTINLLNYGVYCKSESFLFFSSGEIYGNPIESDRLIKEVDIGYLDPMQVRSCYAESKRIGETMCVAWAHQYGLHTSVVRPFHTYGPGMALDDGRVFADFVADAVANRDIVLKSDGLAQRPFCYISDASIGFFSVLLKGQKGEAYNISNPEGEISMRDLAHTIAGLVPERGIGVKYDIPPSENTYLKSTVQRACPSIDKARKLGWTPKIGISDGFTRTIDSYIWNKL